MKRTGFLLSVVAGPIRAYSIQLHWGWFVAPIFKIAAPSLVLCYGLMLTAMLLTFVYTGQKDETEEEQLKRGIFNLAYGLVSMLLGYIVHCLGGAA